ncbi:hypothetical protein SLS62_001099 [Diatrype stigma]|uniref:DUF3835 domain-containing protein n=1 Tax=Diatrype stigma TaxID=117547 RepID=A0AAN9V0U7_9PEZI
MADAKDSLATLERHIQVLQKNVEKFSNALNHWQQWKEEYETLREDVKTLPPSANRKDLARTRETFEGELIKEKELVEIFGKDDSKKPDQIKSILTNRLDYVTKNIQTLQKQLETAENKLADTNVISDPDAATEEDGLPITEIMEELDDDDNVVSYSLRVPGGKNQKELLETLEKLGIKEEDIPEGGPEGGPQPSDVAEKVDTPQITSPAESAEPAAAVQPAPTPAPSAPAPSAPSKETQEPRVKERAKPKTVAKKKSVAFAEDTKPAEPVSEQDIEQEESETSKRLVEILRKARDDEGIIENPILPADEPPEDAALREDMIRYNKETMEYEMAPIVAELNLEEGSEFGTDDYSDFDDDDEDDDDEDDEWGRSKKPIVDDDWKRQMLELKERLSHHTFGANKADDDDDESDGGDGMGRITIRNEEPPLSEQAPTPSDSKKEVRFAQTVDIASEPTTRSSPASAPVQIKPAQKAVVEPLSDIVMERSQRQSEPTPKSNKKPSRFRKERANGNVPTFQGMPVAPAIPAAADQLQQTENMAPSGPEGRTLSTSVLEHEPSTEAREPDQFDAGLLRQQAAEEYHRMRNRLVHRQGGFLKEDERPVRPLDEEEGGPKRVSRFKAARLAKS